MGQKRDWTKAYHEAGHAVVARVLGVEVTYVTLFSTDETNSAIAQTRSATWLARGADDTTLLAAAEKDLKISLAGPLADAWYRPKRRDKQDDWQADLAHARQSAAHAVSIRRGANPLDANGQVKPGVKTELTHDEAQECLHLINQLWEETDKLIADNWPAVTRVAEMLFERRILSGDDVDSLIADRISIPELLLRQRKR